MTGTTETLTPYGLAPTRTRQTRRTRRELALTLLPIAVLVVTLPTPVAAKDDDDRKNSKPAQRAPAPARPVAPVVNVPAARPLVAPQGAERMVSDSVRLTGINGSGAGPVRLDLEGGHPSTAYEVSYVPASNPTVGVVLGTVRTDSGGAFKGTAPEPMPAIAEAGRSGVLVLIRKG